MEILIIKDTTLTGIADAVREKTGMTEAIPLPEVESAIRSIPVAQDVPNGMEVSF